MIRAIFKAKEGVKRFAGYSSVDYSSSSDQETVVETSESELNSLIPDGESSWKDVKEKLILEGGEIGFDSDYSPPDPTSGGA